MNNSLIFSFCKVLILGDIILDRYIEGKISRISPEAPVPVVKKRNMFSRLGGAGNVAANITGIGCECCLISACGKDSMRFELQELLNAAKSEFFLYHDEKRPTISKTRIMSGQHHLLRIDDENTQELSADAEKIILSEFSQRLSSHDAVIISDYGKGVCSASICQKAIQQCRKQNIPVFVDPKGTCWLKYQYATCITPNLSEFTSEAGKNGENMQDGLGGAAKICASLELEKLLITLGADGMRLVDPGGEVDQVKAKARQVFDVSGAGDTVIAVFAASRAVQMDWKTSMRMANLAAGIVVGKIGTLPITLEEMQEEISREQNGHLDKIQLLDQAINKIFFWKKNGDKIVFTNGCFDLLHPGHVYLLHQASQRGDKLVVGVNSDQSVKRLKGSGRPVLNQKDRSTLLASLQDVDMVVIFDEDTPKSLIASIRPDILVKGSDYSRKTVVGADLVESWGGEVSLVDLQEAFGTTAIIEKIAQRHETSNDTP